MTETWDILQKELAFQGFRLLSNSGCEYHTSKGIKRQSLKKTREMLEREIVDNQQLLKQVWNDTCNLLLDIPDEPIEAVDLQSRKLFVNSLKSLARWLDCFDYQGVKNYKHVIDYAMNRDSLTYSQYQIYHLPDYQLSIDWIHRLITRLIYIRKLIAFASRGKSYVNSHKIVEARGVGGPWSKLDLPMRERVWEWWEEGENFRKRDEEIRKQRRYKKGLENYNNGGSVGEGHYWREIRNEPYSWYSSDSESPYPHRNTLFHHG